jgi:aryl-alcohol dehydrogenase-like predicted oxidoreductase
MQKFNDAGTKHSMNRRSFLGVTGAVAVASVAGGHAVSAAAERGTQVRMNGRRKLGSLEVSSVGLGVQNVSRSYETLVPYRPEMINIIRAAYDHGVTFFDTAEAYGPLECERILGESIQSFRNKVVITSKFGWNIDPETGRFQMGLNSKPDHIKKAVEGMLKRLRTDRIDLLYQHRVDPQVPIEDVAGAVKDLMSEGKILHWGLCEMGPNTLRRAHAALPVSAVQNEYSMLWRGPEQVIIPLCQELGIGFVPWSPLGVQFLTGAIDENSRFAPGDIRGMEPRFSPENMKHNIELVKLVKQWADRKNTAPGQIALAWLMGAETLDRANPRHDADGAPDPKRRCHFGCVQPGRTQGAECLNIEYSDSGKTPAGRDSRTLGRRGAGEEIESERCTTDTGTSTTHIEGEP